MSRFFRTAFAALILFAASSIQAAVIYETSSFGLVGAKNVLVNGSLYDVRFQRGNCVMVFEQCTNDSFVFRDFKAASDATIALFEQVFINTSAGNFDAVYSGPCASDFSCVAFTPYAVDGNLVRGALAANYNSVDDGEIDPFNGTRGIGGNDWMWRLSDVYAEWTVAEASVPEPSSTALIATSLAALVFSRRRKSQPKAAE